jgi:hypothetical protein
MCLGADAGRTHEGFSYFTGPYQHPTPLGKGAIVQLWRFQAKAQRGASGPAASGWAGPATTGLGTATAVCIPHHSGWK